MLLRLVSPISGVLYSTDGCCLGKALLRVQIRLEFKFKSAQLHTKQSNLLLIWSILTPIRSSQTLLCSMMVFNFISGR